MTVPVHTRRERTTGQLLSVGRAETYGVEPADGGPWVTYCEAHATLVQSDTRATAMQVTGNDFCAPCQEALSHGALTPGQRKQMEAAIRHLGRAMRALDRAGLLATQPDTRAHAGRWAIHDGARSLTQASDRLIAGMQLLDGDADAESQAFETVDV